MVLRRLAFGADWLYWRTASGGGCRTVIFGAGTFGTVGVGGGSVLAALLNIIIMSGVQTTSSLGAFGASFGFGCSNLYVGKTAAPSEEDFFFFFFFCFITCSSDSESESSFVSLALLLPLLLLLELMRLRLLDRVTFLALLVFLSLPQQLVGSACIAVQISSSSVC